MPMVTDTASAISQGCGRRDQWGGHRAGPFESALGDVEGRTPKGDSAIVPISRPLLYYETIGRKLWRTFLRQNEMVLFY
jgi:hypothetical protein